MDPPGEVVHQIYRAVRMDIPQPRGGRGDPTLAKQPWLREVSDEFHRRLKANGIYVEGAND
jgi:hypothetical protein